MLAAGTTRTASIDGISAAGANPSVLVHTPCADAEIVTYGRPVDTDLVPVSPTGCPTPAVVTRAVRAELDLPFATIDAGLARPTAAPTIDVGASPGEDVRAPEAVPEAGTIVETSRNLGESLPDDELLVGETIPGGTTTALGVLAALGERRTVSSSLPENPLGLKREVVEAGLVASDLEPGDCAGEPITAIRAVGDPVQATVVGLVAGALEAGTSVTLAGGTQQLAIAALLRHAGVDESLSVATTSYVSADESAAVTELADELDVDLTVTDPGFGATGHGSMHRFAAGEAKEGVGMGGALALAVDAGILPTVRDRVALLSDRLVDGSPGSDTVGDRGAVDLEVDVDAEEPANRDADGTRSADGTDPSPAGGDSRAR